MHSFSFNICYDKIDEYGQLCTFLPNYWPWSLCKVLFTLFEKSIFLCDYLAKSDGVFTEL